MDHSTVFVGHTFVTQPCQLCSMRDVSEPTAIGWALYDTGDFDGAARRFKEALQADPNDVEALQGLARIRLSRNDLAAAIVLLERALDVLAVTAADTSDRERRLRHDLAWALYRVDRLDLAARHFSHLPEHEPIVRKLEAFDGKRPYAVSLGATSRETASEGAATGDRFSATRCAYYRRP